VLLSLHFYDINADPSILKSTEDIHDEAWWAENARQKILNDRWTSDGVAGALAAGPFTVVWYYLVFSTLGISFFTLRLISLIPFSLLIFVLLYRYLFKSKESHVKSSLRNTLLMLLYLPLLFDWTRLGHPEMLMSCLGLASFVVGRKDGKYNMIFSGIIAALALFVKGSFVYHFLAIGIVLMGTDYRLFFRRGMQFGAGAAIVALPMWFAYYLPNADFFATYQNLFAGEYYTWQQLLHPAGIVFRLIHIAEKPFINDPVSSILIAVLALRLLSGKSSHDTCSFTALLFVSFLLVLGSDFSPRRLVFSMLLLPFALTEKQVDSPSSWWKNGIVYSVLALQLMPYCWPKAWISWKITHVGIDYSNLLWLAVVAQTVFTMGFAYVISRFKDKSKFNFFLSLLPVMAWWFVIQQHTWQRINCGLLNETEVLTLLVAGALCLWLCFIIPSRQAVAIMLLCCLWLGIVFPMRSHGVEAAAQFLAKEGKRNDYAIGYGLPYTITFLSSISPVFHPDSEKKLPVRWCIGVSSPEFRYRSNEADQNRFFPGEAVKSHSFSLYNKREKAWILERTFNLDGSYQSYSHRFELKKGCFLRRHPFIVNN